MNTEFLIDYQNFVSYVPLIFIVVGVGRGVRRELFSLFLALALDYLIMHPEAASKLLTLANNWLNVLRTVLQNPGIAQNMQAFAQAYSQQPPLFTTSDPAPFFIAFLLVLWVMSYVMGGWVVGVGQRSALSAILGGVLGYVNATIVISLVRTFLLGTFLDPSSPQTISSQVTVPTTLTVEVQNVPTQTGLPVDPTLLLIVLVGVGIVIFWLFLANHFKTPVPNALK